MRVLIVEDEALVAALLSDWLDELGHEIVGPVVTAEAALLVGPSEIDAALLDLHLRGGDSYAVAARLRVNGIPFAFASGSEPEEMRDGFQGIPLLLKPFRFEDLEAVVRSWDQSGPTSG